LKRGGLQKKQKTLAGRGGYDIIRRKYVEFKTANLGGGKGVEGGNGYWEEKKKNKHCLTDGTSEGENKYQRGQ